MKALRQRPPVDIECLDLLCRDRQRELDDAAERAIEWQAKADSILERHHPWQVGLCNDQGRRIVVVAGRGGGKTTCIGDRLLRRMMLTYEARCLYVAATREAAIDLLWNPLKDALERLQLGAKLDETTLRCYLPHTRSRLRLVGADDKKQIEKYRGQPFHEVWIDEAASFNHQLLEHLIERIISPRLGDYRGTLGLAGTPGHDLNGAFYDASRPGSDQHRRWEDREDPKFAGWTNWSFHHWTAEDAAPFVPAIANVWAEALVEKQTKGWSDSHPVWMREYLGLWAADNTDTVFRYKAHDETGKEWNQWNPAKDPRTGFAILPNLGAKDGWRYVYGIDPGYTDPFALEVFAWHSNDRSRTLYHVYEFEQREMYARTIAELLLGPELNHDKPTGLFGATGWPDATAVDLTHSEALVKELLEVYGIKLDKADKAEKFDAIELFNGDLIEGRIKVLKGSMLETQLIQNQWARDDWGQRKRNKSQRDDCADAAVYARRRAHHLLTEEAPPKKKTPVAEYQRREEDAPASAGEFDHLFRNDYPSEDFWGG